MMMRFVVAALGLSLLAACPKPVECKADGDCGSGQVCNNSKCENASASSSSSSSSSGGGGSSSRAVVVVSSSGTRPLSSSAAPFVSSSAVVVTGSSGTSSASSSSTSGGGNDAGYQLEFGGIGTVGDAWLASPDSGYVLTEMGFEGLGIACSDAGMCVTGGITP